MKTCTKCNERKALSEFGKDSQKSDGLGSHCKSCKNAQGRRYRAANPEKARETEKNWKLRNKERVVEYSRKWKEENAEKVRELARVYAAARRKKYPEKIAEAKAAYRLANKEKIAKKDAAYRAAHPEVRRAHAEANRDSILERARAYREANILQFRAYSAKRRAVKAAAGGSYTQEDLQDLFAKQRGRCACCKGSIRREYHADHIVALANGGSNDKLNIQLLCKKCNLQKHTKHPIDFMQLKGFLL